MATCNMGILRFFVYKQKSLIEVVQRVDREGRIGRGAHEENERHNTRSSFLILKDSHVMLTTS
jgi:hypothetical protein